MDHSPLDDRATASEASSDTTRLQAAAGDPSQPANPSDPLDRYPNLEAWVTQWLLPVYRRSVSGDDQTWCPEWWRHPEVVVRLTALWRAWLAAHNEDGAAMSAWWTYHADHHLPIILSARGPLKGCTPEQHSTRPTPVLPSTPTDTPMFAEIQQLIPTPSPAAEPSPESEDEDPWPTTPDLTNEGSVRPVT